VSLSEFVVLVTVALLVAPLIAFLAFVMAMIGMGCLSVVVWLADKFLWRVD